MCREHSCVCWKLEEEGRKGFLQEKNRPKSYFLLWLIGFSFGLWMLCLYSNEVVSRGTSRNRCGERIKALSRKDVQNVRNWAVCSWVLLHLVTWSLCVSSSVGFRGWGFSFLSIQDVPVKHKKMPTHHTELGAGGCVSAPSFWRAELGYSCPGPGSLVGWKGPSHSRAVSNSLCHQAVKKVIRW